MTRLRNEIWCLLGWTLAVVLMRVGDEIVYMSGSGWNDSILHLIFWAVGILALHLIFRAFRRRGIEQEQAREALRASEQHYRELFMHTSEGFAVHEMICDPQGRPVDYRFVAVNPAFERITGLSAAGTVGRTLRELLPGVEAEWLQKYGRVVETGEPIRFEQPASELGKVFSVEAFRPAPGMFACTFTDITEQRAREETIVQSEARLSAILQSIDDLVFVVDNEGRFAKFAQSERAELLKTAAEFEGRPCSEVLPPIVAERLALAIERVRETGRTQPFEYELTLDGMTTCWSARVSPLRDPERGILGSVVVTRDITTRRLNEQRLRQRNRFLEGVENISTILLGDIDAPDTFDRVAQEVALMTGFSSAVITLVRSGANKGEFRFVGLAGLVNDQRVLSEDRLDNVVTDRVIRERTAVSIEGVADVRDAVHERFKDEGFARVVAVPIFHGENALGTVMVADRQSEAADSVLIHVLSGVANQIAIHFARIETEKARRRNEAELLSIYEHAPVIMALLDESAGVIRSNRAAQEFSGLNFETGRALRPGELLGCLGSLHSADGCGHGPACGHCALRHAVLDTIHTGKTCRQIDVRKEIVSGRSVRTVDLLVSTAALNFDGARRVLLVMEDVTKVRVAEERVREQAALLDVTHDAIFVHDTTGRILFWNKGAENLYHVPRTEAVGRRVEELIVSRAPSDAAGTVRSIGGVTESEQATRDGRQIVVQSRCSEIRDDSGAVRSILVVNTDITELRRLNQHLLRAQRLESIGTLASGIAHDRNNILAPIMMSIGLLRPKCGESERSILEMIETCVRRGGDILRQVLLFARGVDGERVAVQPRHMLNEVLRIIRETFPRSISITTGVCRDPWTITGEPTQIQQVLLNMCVNARDAMPHGGELRVAVSNRTIQPDEPRIHPRAEPGRYVLIEVTDTGTGMPPELLEKIFDPFFTTKPQGQGTGLGLATSLGIVEKHCGFVHVQSTVGRGSTFCIYFPAGDASPASAAAIEAPVPAGDGARILVVDDEPAVRMLVKHMLEMAGYRVSVAYDGQEAVDLLRDDKEGFAVIVTDLMMPRLDGVRFIEALRTMLPTQPIIAMTGVGEERRVQEVMAAGVRIVLNKPFESAELLRTIHRVRAMPGASTTVGP